MGSFALIIMGDSRLVNVSPKDFDIDVGILRTTDIPTIPIGNIARFLALYNI
jgi:hypothetical protein